MSSARLGDKIHETVCTVNILCREAATKVQLDKTRWADCSPCCSMLTTNGTVRYLDHSEHCKLYCCIKCKEIIINVRHEGLIFFNLNAGVLLSFNKITSFEPNWVKASLSHTANSFSFPSYVPVPAQSSACLLYTSCRRCLHHSCFGVTKISGLLMSEDTSNPSKN